MFEQELEMEKKEGSGFGPILVVLVLVGLFVGGIGVVIFQSRQSLKPEQAASLVEAKLKPSTPVSVKFHTGNVSYFGYEKVSDPQYKLLQIAGMISIGKGKSADVAQVDLTPQGKEFLASLPNVKGMPDADNTTAYVIPLAFHKLVSVDKVTKLSEERTQIQYTWVWKTTKAGDIFDISGKSVQGLPAYDRGLLIDRQGADYYHGAPLHATMFVTKGDQGWEPLSAN